MKLPSQGPEYWARSNGNGPRHLLADGHRATLCKRTRFSVHRRGSVAVAGGPLCAACLAVYARLPDPEAAATNVGDRRRKDSGVGAWLRELRKQAGLPQVEVARRMGCAPSRISHLERGNHDPHISTILRYGHAIGARIHIGLVEQAHTDTTSKEQP